MLHPVTGELHDRIEVLDPWMQNRKMAAMLNADNHC
jgi:hypothetical protein